MKKLPFLLIALTVLLAGCGTSNKFASSFGKRRYNKGFYKDVAEGVKVPVAAKTIAKAIDVKPAEVKPQVVKQVVVQRPQEPVIVANKPVNPVSKPASKPIAKANKRSTLPVAENSAIADAILSHHLEIEQSTTSFSVFAIFFMIAAWTGLLVFFFLILASAPLPAGSMLVTEGLIVLFLLGAASVVCGILAITHNEPHIGPAYIAIGGSVLLFLLLLSVFGNL